MPNGVKYSTTTPSGSLRRDNVALGVNGNLGPTANTGFYSMPTPASGKYIINKVAASGVPNFFAPQNDTELIQFARNEGATGANTGSAAAVLAWIATQPNLEAANFEYEGIVTEGLVLNLDAGFVGSYPTINTTWYDISGNNNNGALTNGPTFNSANSGSIVFDGIDDYISVANFDYGRTGFTAEAWFKYNTYSPSGYKSGILMKWQTGAGTNNEFCLYTEGSSANTPYWPGFAIQGNNNIIYNIQDTSLIQVTGSWYHQVGTFDGTYLKLYVNGVLRTTSSPTGTNTVKTYSAQPFSIASFGSNIANQGSELYSSPASIGNVKLYNRALTATEVSQNYNAQKGRFGL
jgi:hypothetical protein